ncbi:zinc finger protein 454-like [Spea bombifrons]|uniref:zinc finger protein 454-like n=1 Tax=Spea bombifrons TaxID=233779 RepID=UPI00234A9F6F|nr:zinc finger protein 454-like [Spea bombifrons]
MDSTVATQNRSFGPSEDLKPLMGCSELVSPFIVTKKVDVSPKEEPLEWLISDVRSIAEPRLEIISGKCLRSESFLLKIGQGIKGLVPNAQDFSSVVTDIDIEKKQFEETPCALGELEKEVQKVNNVWNYTQELKHVKHESEVGCLHVKAELSSTEIFNQMLVPRTSNLLSNKSCHPPSLAPELLFKCETCDKVMKNLASLREHQRIHTGERPFKCKVCKKHFIRCADLIKHGLVHSNSRPHGCKECGKKFKLAGDLRKHSKVHSDQFPFKCESCEKKFKRAACLNKHMRVHTEEKPFPCPVCGKRFKWQSSVREHQRIHSGEKPFQCPDCMKRFTHLSTFLQHNRIHKESAAFTCDICDKSFNHKSNLRKHQRALHT